MSYLDDPIVESYADIYFEQAQRTIQAGDPRLPFRVLEYRPEATHDDPAPPARFYFYLGRGGWHDAYTIVHDVMIDDRHMNALIQGPLPEEVPMPAPFDEGQFTSFECSLIFGLLRGYDRGVLATRMGGKEICAEIMEHVTSLGLIIHGSTYAKKIEADLLERRTAELSTAYFPKDEATHAHDPIDPDAPASHATPTAHTPKITFLQDLDPHTAAPLDAYREHIDPSVLPTSDNPIGPITKMPADLFEKLCKARKPGNTAAGRIRWPFKSMEVGDRVVISGALAGKASSAAHVYAHRTKRVFTIHKDKVSGGVVITRLPD